MTSDNKEILVVNKAYGTVVYKLPEMNNLRRTFEPGASKKITFAELKALSYTTSGLTLLKDYLTIMDEEVVEELIGTVEPEYYYTKKEVENLLIFGTLDELEDCLNFAPQGILDMIKTLAIELKLNEADKRKMISNKFSINLDKAIEWQIEDEAEKAPETKVVRKATVKSAESDATSQDVAPTPARKASPVKIVSK